MLGMGRNRLDRPRQPAGRRRGRDGRTSGGYRCETNRNVSGLPVRTTMTGKYELAIPGGNRPT